MNTAKHRRIFVDDRLLIDSFESVAHYLDNLVNRKLESPSDLKKWLKDKSELEAVLEENMAWRYIRMSIDTTNTEFSEAYNFFVSEIHKFNPLKNFGNR